MDKYHIYVRMLFETQTVTLAQAKKARSIQAALAAGWRGLWR